METRLTLLVFAVSLVAGCGGPSDESPQQAAPDQNQQPVVQRVGEQPVEETGVDLGDLLESNGEEGLSTLQAGSGSGGEVADDPSSPFRKWTDRSGKLLAKAEFITLQAGKVCLQKEDGEGIFLVLDQLSEVDRKYVSSQAGGGLTGPSEEEAGPVRSDELSALHPSGPVTGAPQTAENYLSSGRRKVVIPFDFVSKFDDGDYGQRVGEGILIKLNKEGGFIIPDSMYDVRDLCAANNVKIGPDTPLSEVRRVVKDYFDADIGIWGSVERVPGHEWDVYDLVIKCVDFSISAQPKVIYQCSARTKVVSEIPHLYRKEMLDKLYDRQPGGPPPVDQFAEENWKKNPSLVQGDFERGTGGVPAGWASVGGQQREPLGKLVSWVPESGNPDNKVIRFTFGKGVGNSTGVMYYSDWFPIDEGAKYRFQCRYRTNGPSIIVFIKCYSEMGSEYQGASQGGASAGNRYSPGAGDYVPEEAQRRECYRSQQNLKGPKNVWNVHTEDFTPKHTKYVPRWGRVDLYSYLGAGVVEFDDVVLKQIVPASPSESIKDPRHSMETTVTMKEMEENERRGREAAERLRQESAGER